MYLYANFARERIEFYTNAGCDGHNKSQLYVSCLYWLIHWCFEDLVGVPLADEDAKKLLMLLLTLKMSKYAKVRICV